MCLLNSCNFIRKNTTKFTFSRRFPDLPSRKPTRAKSSIAVWSRRKTLVWNAFPGKYARSNHLCSRHTFISMRRVYQYVFMFQQDTHTHQLNLVKTCTNVENISMPQFDQLTIAHAVFDQHLHVSKM